MKCGEITVMHMLNRFRGLASLLCVLVSLALPGYLRASIAYGSINNFDTVNDTGHVCHGFEIEIEDCRTTDITYTYNYNHYGVPRFEQDDTDPLHPKCRIRWESKKNPDNSWASYTAIPSGPIAPTNGHMFTNPSVNFGGEHFGARGFSCHEAILDDLVFVAAETGFLVGSKGQRFAFTQRSLADGGDDFVAFGQLHFIAGLEGRAGGLHGGVEIVERAEILVTGVGY